MPAVIDATVAGSNANSFATVEQANAYFDGRINGEFWVDLEPDVQIRSLITATRLIVQAFNRIGWQGYPLTPSQRLPFPRTGVRTPDGWIVPYGANPSALVDATAELAGRLAQEGMPDVPSETEGMKSFTAGPVTAEWYESMPSDPTALPAAVYDMISFLAAQPMSRTSVPLIRS
jgi:hypothetical protein